MITEIATALVTPFGEGGICAKTLADLIDRQVAAGVSQVIVGTLAGEGPTLTLEEREKLFQSAVSAAAGRLSVFADTSSNSTPKAIALARAAEKAGAAGVIVSAPYYSRPSQEGIFCHIEAAAQSVSLPVILENSPRSTAIAILPSTFKRLSESINLAGVIDGSQDPYCLIEIAKICAARNIARLVNGEQSPFAFHFPPDGCVSVAANVVPATCRSSWGARIRGSSDRRADQFALLCRALDMEPHPATLKCALSLISDGFDPRTRLPITDVNAATASAVRHALENLAEAA